MKIQKYDVDPRFPMLSLGKEGFHFCGTHICLLSCFYEYALLLSFKIKIFFKYASKKGNMHSLWNF